MAKEDLKLEGQRKNSIVQFTIKQPLVFGIYLNKKKRKEISMDKKKFINLLNDRKDDLHNCLLNPKTQWVNADVLGKAAIEIGYLRDAIRDCPEVFSELDDDQILIIIATLQFADFVAKMSDSYSVTRSEQSENSSIRRQISELIGEHLPVRLYW